jgi:hypothetical protein
MSERQDGERRIGRRTYLKGLAAVGLTTSLSGCLGTFSSSVIGLEPAYAREQFDSAEHRTVSRTLVQDTRIMPASATLESQAMAYLQEESEEGEVTNGFGAFTSPILSEFAVSQLNGKQNPLVDRSIEQLFVAPETAEHLLEGFGIDVGSRVNWEEGPIHSDGKTTDIEGAPIEVMESAVSEAGFTRGVLRDGDTLRAVWISSFKAVENGFGVGEVTFVGSSLQQVVQEGVEMESLPDRKPASDSDLANANSQLQEIDPETDLEGLQ